MDQKVTDIIAKVQELKELRRIAEGMQSEIDALQEAVKRFMGREESAYQMQKGSQAVFKNCLAVFLALCLDRLWNGHVGQPHGISSSWKRDYSVLFFLPCMTMAIMAAQLMKHIAIHRPIRELSPVSGRGFTT